MKVGFYNIDLWSFMDDSDNFKSHLLLFDKLILEHGPLHLIETLMSVMPNGQDEFRKKMEYFEKLNKLGLIEFIDKSNFKIPDYLMADEMFVESYSKSIEHYNKIKGIGERNKNKDIITLYSEFMELDRTAGEYSTRYKSIVLSETIPENEYTPILRNFNSKKIRGVKTTKSEVISIILKDLPDISNDITPEQILEFKNSNDIKSRYFELRDFITNLSKQNLSPIEIEEKIEFLRNEYMNGLQLLKFKFSQSTLETVCIMAAEIVENLATLKFSKAVKAIFELHKKEIALLEAERSLKGRETSYLYKIKSELS